MKPFFWNPDKNKQLKIERGISFEDAVFHISAGDILATYEHPNPERYPSSWIHAIRIESYVYLVPFVENDEEVLLKTVIPSRKATKEYLGDLDE